MALVSELVFGGISKRSRRAARKIRAIETGPGRNDSVSNHESDTGEVAVRNPRTKDLTGQSCLAKTSGQGFLKLSLLSLTVAVSLLPVQVHFTLLAFDVESTANFVVILRNYSSL
ncbi:hypothetical protein RvY_16367 [Ramazzottius varieornatus]|uniref:Uncharacterized protein n=1 Tax=Ramazzottius varieornatus TaxID=947166 RepID=A0A1D1W2K4_RAMVA|nr:hypothetical protein RvY_16367 [Ramazzottius varieornatus]